MTNRELQKAFEREINANKDIFNKPSSSETEWWLNQGLEKFYKTRFSGLNYKRTGFELDQKRIDDLRTLVSNQSLSPTVGNNQEYNITLPSDYMILLGDRVGIKPADDIDMPCWEKRDDQYITKYSESIECTIDNIDRERENSLSEYRLKYCYARPLRLILDKSIKLFTDGKYKVTEYSLTYLKQPSKIDIHTNPTSEYTDMPEHTHSEIVKLAALMYIENKKDERYTSISNEVNTME